MLELGLFPMRVAVGSDHAGFPLKQHLLEWLREEGHQVSDFGAHSSDPTDYPDYAAEVGRAVASGSADYGLLVCGTGVGMSIAANKLAGIRAALAVYPEHVRLARAHNDANVLTLGCTLTDQATADGLVKLFLTTDFEGGRHARRVGKIAALDRRECNNQHRESE